MQGLYSLKQGKRWNVIQKRYSKLARGSSSLFSKNTTPHSYGNSLDLLRVKLKLFFFSPDKSRAHWLSYEENFHCMLMPSHPHVQECRT